MNKVNINILVAIVAVVALGLLIGIVFDDTLAMRYVESNEPPVWGKGELPADYVDFFGTDNAARLNKAQSDMLNRHQVVIHGLDRTKEGENSHMNGLIDMVVNLQNRVKVLEAVDPNEIKIK